MRSTPPAEVSSAGGGESKMQHALLWGFLVLLIAPPLFFSSSEYVAWGRLLAALCVFPLARKAFPEGLKGLDIRWKIAIGGLLIAHAASCVGGWQYGDSTLTILRLSAEGLLTVAGFAIGISLVLAGRWQSILIKLGWVILLPGLICSLVGYFLPIERHLAMGGSLMYYEPIRLSLLWPTRSLTAWMGQLGWEHANHAAFIFSVAWVVIIETLAGGNGKFRWARWFVAGALFVGIFLTGSRNGWLILAASLPFLVLGRPFRFSVKIALLLIVSLVIGCLCLKAKRSAMESAAAAAAAPPVITESGEPTPPLQPPPPAPPEKDLHLEGLLKRGSAGRLEGYRMLWQDLQDDQWTGQGLNITGSEVYHLSHEHSSYFATLRGGGSIALAGHLLLISTAGWAALSLFRNGCRWPLVIFVAVITGLLVDHSNVIRLTGRHEFLLHWLVILIPLVLISRDSKTPSVTKPLGNIWTAMIR